MDAYGKDVASYDTFGFGEGNIALIVFVIFRKLVEFVPNNQIETNLKKKVDGPRRPFNFRISAIRRRAVDGTCYHAIYKSESASGIRSWRGLNSEFAMDNLVSLNNATQCSRNWFT